MIFFFKKKKLVLNCVTDRQDVATYAPIKHAHAFYPDWWKTLPKTYQVPDVAADIATMKLCVGMRDLFQHGFIMPMWSDLNVDIGEIGTDYYRYQFADTSSVIQEHPAQQRVGFADNNLYQHLKIASPWRLQCEEDVPFIWLEPTWNKQNLTQYTFLPAVLEYKYQHATHINLLFTRNVQGTSRVTFSFREPLVHVTPITERELDIRVIEDANLYRRLAPLRSSFVNDYKIKKDMQKQKCPKEKNT